METKKQTAVEWLEYKLANTPTEELVFLWRNIFDQAKAMEKEQHFESYRCGNLFLDENSLDFEGYFEQYYNKTYNK